MWSLRLAVSILCLCSAGSAASVDRPWAQDSVGTLISAVTSAFFLVGILVYGMMFCACSKGNREKSKNVPSSGQVLSKPVVQGADAQVVVEEGIEEKEPMGNNPSLTAIQTDQLLKDTKRSGSHDVSDVRLVMESEDKPVAVPAAGPCPAPALKSEAGKKGSDKGSKKGSDKGSKKGSKKGSEKGSKKGSKKGSDKGSKKKNTSSKKQKKQPPSNMQTNAASGTYPVKWDSAPPRGIGTVPPAAPTREFLTAGITADTATTGAGYKTMGVHTRQSQIHTCT